MTEPSPSRREIILATMSDLVADFLYYDRKEDQNLPRGEIEAAIESGEVTVDELAAAFRSGLEGSGE